MSASGLEILPSDLELGVDWSDESVRMLFARRLAPEIAGEPFVEDPENTRSRVLTRSDAVGKLERIFQAMHEADEKSAGTRRRRGLIDNQRRYEAVTGESLADALERVAEEYHEEDISTVAKWVLK